MSKLFSLIKKDLLIEFRTRETILLYFCMSLLISVVFAFAVQNAFLSPIHIYALFPGSLWVVFAIVSSVVAGRSYEHEINNRAVDGVLVTGVDPSIMFIAKALSLFAVLALGTFFSTIFLLVLLDLSISGVVIELIFVTALVSFGFSALSTLTSALASGSSLRAILMPIVILPLLFPLFFCAMQLTSDLITLHHLNGESPWLSLLIGLDVVYILCGINLYKFALKE